MSVCILLLFIHELHSHIGSVSYRDVTSYPSTTTISSGSNDVIWNIIELNGRDKKKS